MIARSVGMTEPTVAPLPRCASGMSARCGKTNGSDAAASAWTSVFGSMMLAGRVGQRYPVTAADDQRPVQ
jgi:hypothetical protein